MKRSERGANLIEFAIVAPLLVLLMVGVTDVGRAFHSYMIITNAAREGARAASRLSCYSTDAAQRAVYRDRIVATTRAEVAGSLIDPAELTVAISPDPLAGCQAPGQAIRVTTSVPFAILAGQLIGVPDLTLQSTAAMARIDNTPG